MAGEGRGLAARAAAVDLVLGVTEERVQLSVLTARPGFLALAPEERARGQRMALATLRQISRADAALKPFLRKEPPPMVRALLRVATVEMLGEGAPAHGVVSAAVSMLRARGRQAEGFSGLANAVLRRVSETSAADWAALPAPVLPPWLRNRLIAAWGKPAVQAIERAHAEGASLDLTARDGDAAALAAQVGGVALPGGSVRLAAAAQVSGLAGFAEGAFWVQDVAATLAARVLAPTPGERVLDLCAAPGGKTLQLAAAGAQVTALDVSEARLVRLRHNLARCRLTAEVVVADALDWQPDAPFDAVLLDAPCSATGTIRRHPDMPYLRDAAALRNLCSLQERLIDRAAGLLRPGGRLVYCTCSLLPEEGERQIAAALSRHPGLGADPAAHARPGIAAAWATGDCGLRTRPDLWPEGWPVEGPGGAVAPGMDGFYVAALRRSG